jgi:hypothetical protein
MVGLDGYPAKRSGWGLCNFRELFGQSFTEMRSLTSLPVLISETDLAPLSSTGAKHALFPVLATSLDDDLAVGPCGEALAGLDEIAVRTVSADEVPGARTAYGVRPDASRADAASAHNRQSRPQVTGNGSRPRSGLRFVAGSRSPSADRTLRAFGMLGRRGVETSLWTCRCLVCRRRRCRAACWPGIGKRHAQAVA